MRCMRTERQSTSADLADPNAGDPKAAARRLLVASEVADLLQVTTAWVYSETRSHRLPHIRLGRYVRYRREAIDAWLQATEQSSGRRR